MRNRARLVIHRIQELRPVFECSAWARGLAAGDRDRCATGTGVRGDVASRAVARSTGVLTFYKEAVTAWPTVTVPCLTRAVGSPLAR